MKRLSDLEKKQLGVIIQYYRNYYYRSNIKNKEQFKQVNFCNGICSQAQLSRLEHGDVLKDHNVYYALLDKLNLFYEKVSAKDYVEFESYFENILMVLNDEHQVINYNEYLFVINKYHNTFKKNIIYTHYNYALEFIVAILNDDVEEATCLLEEVENTLDILKPKLLVITLYYLGLYYHLIKDYNQANKYYFLALENMDKENINIPMVLVDLAYNNIRFGKYLYALNYLYQAKELLDNSHRYVILTKIYQYYGLVYLYTKYYEDGINILNKALEYSIKANKRYLILQVYCLLVVGHHLNGDKLEANNILLEVKEKYVDEEIELISFIIKNSKEDSLINYHTKYFSLVQEFYLLPNNRDDYYENNLEKILPHLPDSIYLLLINEIYSIYKGNKKYKKVVDFLEKGIFLK